MDVFVRTQQTQGYAGMYRRIVTKLFLAQRFCLGFPQIISLINGVLRIILCYCAARQVSNSIGLTRNVLLEGGWWPLIRGIAAVTAGHAYALLKGYH